ncbi:MAG: hypothetical protein JWP94_3300 [Mucilaginibacter sp.]|nr:hypothetical protein [Mucilaginibacter sp.]
MSFPLLVGVFLSERCPWGNFLDGILIISIAGEVQEGMGGEGCPSDLKLDEIRTSRPLGCHQYTREQHYVVKSCPINYR